MARSLYTTAGVKGTIEISKDDAGSRLEQMHRGVAGKGTAEGGLRGRMNVNAPNATAQELKSEAQNSIVTAQK